MSKGFRTPSDDRAWFRKITNSTASLNRSTKVPRGGIRL